MIKGIATLLGKLLDLLPTSPIKSMMEGLINFTDDFLGMLNWFIPFDVAIIMLGVWLACVTTYYVYKYIKGMVDKIR